MFVPKFMATCLFSFKSRVAVASHLFSLGTLKLLGAFLLIFMAISSAANAQETPWPQGRILVQARVGISDAELDEVLFEHGGRRVGVIDQIRVHIVTVPLYFEEAIAGALSRHPKIAFAEPDALIPPDDTIPNDRYYKYQWHLPLMKAPGAWDYTRGNGVVAAVLDSGVDSSHPDLSGKLVSGWNFYNNNSNTSDVTGHGTAVAGVIGAATNNFKGVAGLAWNAKIMPVRVGDPNGFANISTIASGLTWAADHGARVANISYMVTGSFVMTTAADYFRKKGGLVFSSAGNDGIFLYTSEDSTIITVSATTIKDIMASFSNYGYCVDISAPGEDIYTTVPGRGYDSKDGTSFSSPAAAAVAALLFAVNPMFSPYQVEKLLKQTAVDLGLPGWDPYYGYGRVDAKAAVLAALGTAPQEDTSPPNVVVVSPTKSAKVSGFLPVDVFSSDDSGLAYVELYANGVFIAETRLAPYKFSIDTSSFTGGPLTLMAKAVDEAGNESMSKPVTVIVGNFKDEVDKER